MAQEVRRRGGAAKVDVFDKQIGGDDCFFAGCAAKDCGVVADARDKRFGLSDADATRCRSELMKSNSLLVS